VVQTGFQHNDMRDTGPDDAKTSIQGMLDKFLEDSDNSNSLAPVPTTVPDVTAASGPVAMTKPVTKPVTN
jgi:hypothetical protein